MDKYSERLTGFMQALGCMNDAANRVSDYFVVKLEESESIYTSLAMYHSALTDKFPAAYWHPQLKTCTNELFMDTVELWFFEHQDMQLLPRSLKQRLLSTFKDDFTVMAGNAQLFTLITSLLYGMALYIMSSLSTHHMVDTSSILVAMIECFFTNQSFRFFG